MNRLNQKKQIRLNYIYIVYLFNIIHIIHYNVIDI